MRRLSGPPPPSPLYAGCVPFELVVSAALLYDGITAGGNLTQRSLVIFQLYLLISMSAVLHCSSSDGSDCCFNLLRMPAARYNTGGIIRIFQLATLVVILEDKNMKINNQNKNFQPNNMK
jgi:hypothetical protein